jgi:hypothetical protein
MTKRKSEIFFVMPSSNSLQKMNKLDIQANIDNPKQLEKLYRDNRAALLLFFRLNNGENENDTNEILFLNKNFL